MVKTTDNLKRCVTERIAHSIRALLTRCKTFKYGKNEMLILVCIFVDIHHILSGACVL